MKKRALMAGLILAFFGFIPTQATWSIVLTDSETGEVAVGTVTCLNNFDLLAIVPVIVVEQGAAAVQASGDFQGIRRPVIFDELHMGTDPNTILAQVATITGHQSRQYGIVDVQGRAITFSGDQTLSWAGGLTGSMGTITYAIQGNILTGSCVVDDIETAMLNTVGDMPAMLMAGMQAAKMAGGDGRCSCPGPDAEACGCPPTNFTKSGHIGGMVVARPGDSDDPICDMDGCADGDYFMRINVPNQASGNPDPVDQLQTLFDTFRQDHVGRPDAAQAVVEFIPAQVPPNGISTQIMRIQLRDWQGQPTTANITQAIAAHTPESANQSQIGNTTLLPDGIVEIGLTAGNTPGMDDFVVTVDDGIRPVELMPSISLVIPQLGDLDGNGEVNIADTINQVNQTGPCPGGTQSCLGDLDGNGVVDGADLLLGYALWL